MEIETNIRIFNIKEDTSDGSMFTMVIAKD